MEVLLLIVAAVILLCIFANNFSERFGMPALILFMILGMLFGSDGIFRISFDDYLTAQNICTVALTFIMFYGGFSTKWDVARPVVGKAIALSTIGVILTAAFIGAFCYLILGFSMRESFLVGAVLSSTDAASVFSILRSKNLSLKNGTASLLELESGSNDPIAYMLTMIGILLFKDDKISFGYTLFSQIFYGAIIGVLIAVIAIKLRKKITFSNGNFITIYMVGILLLSFALPQIIGGNGFLSVYLTGIILGNSKIENKAELVHFFNGITGLAQILIFFLLGLLAFPHMLPEAFLQAFMIALFILIIARPIAVLFALLPFKLDVRQYFLVSWSGLRGAASIVFAIMVLADGIKMNIDLFHIVFLISLLSVGFQGMLLPKVAEKLSMVDTETDVRKTFTDYQEEMAITLMRMFIPDGHKWENKFLKDVLIPTGALALMIKRNGNTIIPKGDTMILAGDSVIFSVPGYQIENDIHLSEEIIYKEHKWCDSSIQELDLHKNILITMIRRNGQDIIPSGKTIIQENDIVVTYEV